MRPTVQVPTSLNCGNVTLTELLTVVAGEKSEPKKWFSPPEGLPKSTCTKVLPDRSSVAEKLTATSAGPVAVLMVVGVKVNAVRVGGVTSWTSGRICAGIYGYA